MSTFPDQTSALIPCTRLYPNSQRMIDNLGILVRIRRTETKTARQAAQKKDKKASMVPVETPLKNQRRPGRMSVVGIIQKEKEECGRHPGAI